MRFPKLTELDNDQRHIYEGAPADGSILVIGPPGTGKTVIALHRAGYLKRLGQRPKVLMYNKVLRQYSGSGTGAIGDIEVDTLHSWIGKWWKGVTGSRYVPTVPGDRWSFDWGKLRDKMLHMIMEGKKLGHISWGHILIDEGQDHPEAMYAAMNIIMAAANHANQEKGKKAVLTVLADDNQRLVEGKNATVEQIRQALLLHDSQNNVFMLKKNYRNTLEIARFASNFYVGLKSGTPQLPEKRKGGLPTIYVSGRDTEGKNLNAFVERIAAYAKLRNEEIGVLVPDNRIRESIVNRLRARLEPKVRVQTYASNDSSTDAANLVFDKEGHVTVLNFMSAKGLEFDSVFVVDPGKLASGSVAALQAKMTLYVMCSRARTSLFVMLVKDKATDTLLSWLPRPEGNYKLEEI